MAETVAIILAAGGSTRMNTKLAKVLHEVCGRHHSYIGDATVGQKVNIGAGSITANFDGEKVNKTNIGDHRYIGSGAVLIAPLELKDGSNVGAGTVVSQDNTNELGGKLK